MKKINKKRGYTIIETMVAVSLFIVIVTYGMGTLLSANLLHRKSKDMRSIMDSLSFVMEDMSRNLRTGYNYYCITGSDDLSNVSTTKSGSNCWGVAFESATGSTSNPNDQWVYYINNNGKIFRSTQGPYVVSNFIQLTPDEVVIDSGSSFSVLGAEPPPGDSQQPFVNARLAGKITYKNVITPFSLQTSVSERLLDV